MTTYLDRPAWTSTEASGATLTGTELVGPCYHWPGTSQKIIGVESQAATASRLRGYRNFHVTGRGWRDIGYNVGFDQAGRVWLLRSTVWGVNMVGAHSASATNPRANHQYVGALLILGADEPPSAAMLDAINDWYRDRFLARWEGRTDNRGHGQVLGASTTCPGPHVRAALASGAIPGMADPISQPQEDDDMFVARLGRNAYRLYAAEAYSLTFAEFTELAKWLPVKTIGNAAHAILENKLNGGLFGRLTVSRGERISALQELADAKTLGMQNGAKLDVVLAAVKNAGADVDEAALAAELDKLGVIDVPAIADAVVDELHERTGRLSAGSDAAGI